MLYNKNHDFFTVPNKLNSYWAGFIAADGCITGKQVLSINLAEKDKEHLEKLATLLAEDYQVKTYQHKEGNSYGSTGNYVAFALSSQQWKEDLEKNWGITKRKTATYRFPEHLEEGLRAAFIAGYIDGDGSINTTKAGKKDKLQVSINGTEELLVGIRDFLRTKGVELKNNIYASRGISVLITASTTAKKVCEVFYDEDLPLLERKWGTYLDHKDRNYGQYVGWTAEDEDIMRKYHPVMTIREIHEKFFPNRSYSSVEKKSHYLGLKKHFEKKWTKEEDNTLTKARYESKMGIAEIQREFFPYRSYGSVKQHLKALKKKKEA
jgi:hypothetical protein